MEYNEFHRIMYDVLVSLANRTRRLPRTSPQDFEEALGLSMEIEKLRFLSTQGRDIRTSQNDEIVRRIKDGLDNLSDSQLFKKLIAHQKIGRSISIHSAKSALEDRIGSDVTFQKAITFLHSTSERLLIQQSLDFSELKPSDPSTLKNIIPKQKVSPVQFDIIKEKLIISPQKSQPKIEDFENVASARQTLIDQSERIIKSLEGSNTDPRLKENLLTLHNALSDGNDIIKLGLLAIECECIVRGVEEQMSSASTELLRSHTNGIRLYLSQFPDWRRFIDNSENISLNDIDVKGLLDTTEQLIKNLNNNDAVHGDVPKVISLIRDIAKSPATTSKKAVFALIRTVENLISKIFTYTSIFIDQTINKTSNRVSGAIAVGLASIILAGTINLTGIFRSIPESSWIPDAAKIVEKYIIGSGLE